MGELEKSRMHQYSQNNDWGMSIPLVMGAMMAFSALTVMLFGIAQVSIKHNGVAQDRARAYGAAEAGANDFLNRLNAYPDFVQWDAARVKPMIGTAQDTRPDVVRDSALGQWVRPSSTQSAAFTYDIISQDHLGLVLRVTGRSTPSSSVQRTIEYRVARKTRGSVAVAVQRPVANTPGYAYINQYRAIGNSQGHMAASASGSFLSVADYERLCDNHTVTSPEQLWQTCFRPYWNKHDRVEGDAVIGAPFTVHGTNGFMSNQARATGVHEWPSISGTLEIVGGQPNRHAAASNVVNNTQPVTYADTDIRSQGNQGFLRTSQDVAHAAPPGQYKEIRRIARADQRCRFVGATQILLYGDDVYVRSPHTPHGHNAGAAPWCANASDKLKGVTRTTATTDTTDHDVHTTFGLVPGDNPTWVKLSNVATDAIFIVERVPVGGACVTSVVGDNNGIGNRSGVGFPANRDDSDPLIGTTLNPYDCRNGDVFIDGVAARRKTIIAEDNIYLTGAIRYSDRDMKTNAIPENSDDLLGLVAQRNVFIYNPPSRPCASAYHPVCYRYPRTPFGLPVLKSDLTAASGTTGDRTKWLTMPRDLGPADRWAQRTRMPTERSWMTMPQWDGVIVAETGAFILENPLMHNRPATLSQHGNTNGLAAVVTGAVYSRYAPMLHIDFETPSGEVKMHGLHSHYINDPRLERVLPPGFTGLSATSYRLQGFAEVASDLSLDATHERNSP